MERSLEYPNNNQDYKALLPEIAELLNVSVSTLENYPTDMQAMVCQIYVNNYHLDEVSTIQAIGNAFSLNIDTEKHIESIKASELEKTEKQVKASLEKDNSCDAEKNSILSRKQIVRNAKIISRKLSNRDATLEEETSREKRTS